MFVYSLISFCDIKLKLKQILCKSCTNPEVPPHRRFMKKQVSFEAIEAEAIATATSNNAAEAAISKHESEFDMSDVVLDGELRLK